MNAGVEKIQYRSRAQDYESLNQSRGVSSSGSFGGTLGKNGRGVLAS